MKNNIKSLGDSTRASNAVWRNFFDVLIIFGFKLQTNSILDNKIMIEHFWVCETHARIRFNL